jgi:hypothetical protein
VSGVKQIIEALKGLLVWWVTVAPWERALRVRLGKRVTLLGPGVHLRIPVADRVFGDSGRAPAYRGGHGALPDRGSPPAVRHAPPSGGDHLGRHSGIGG